MTVFYMACCIGRKCLRRESEFELFLEFFLVLSAVMCLIGFILMVGGYDLYRLLGVHEVYIAKAAPFAPGRLDDRFIRTVLGRGIIRMGSIYYEPVNLAYFFALAFLCAVFKNPFRQVSLRYITICFSLAGLVFTLGKGGYIIVLMAVFCLLGAYILRRLFRIPYDKCSDSRLLLAMILISFAGVAAVVILFVIFSHDRELIMPHIRGIAGAAYSIANRPWGYGTGMGGNAAMTFNGNITTKSDWYAIGGETALMSVMYQLGIQGLIVFAICVISTGYNRIKKMSSFEKIVFCMPWILICVSLLQDNTFTPQCIVPYMLVMGGAYKNAD
ncbi:MAG: hypothetical protein K5857_09230 [Lachnospiraceae bacterium]|nr:hypothetical protein [Lachnospiraceae bacterium]